MPAETATSGPTTGRPALATGAARTATHPSPDSSRPDSTRGAVLRSARSFEGAGLLVVGVRQDDDGPRVVSRALDEATRALVTTAARTIGATGKPDELLRLPGDPFGLPALALTGLGPGPDDPGSISQAAGAAVRQVKVADIALAVTDRIDQQAHAAESLGGLLGSYRFRIGAESESGPTSVTIVTGQSGDGEDGRTADDAEATAWLDRVSIVADAVNLARWLVDTPACDLPPAALAAQAQGLAADGVAVEVLDEVALAEQGFGGILAVGGGSAHPPRLVRLAHSPAGASRHLVLIGKGITFDSGGLSLKPAASMATMKYDMAGAAAVLAAVKAIAALRVPLRVTGYLAIAENMPSGTAQRPGDVITSFGGKTVEVLNTDAEGRLVLMDALGRCAADAPDAIVDIATLTGAQLVALGARIAGVMGNDDEWRGEVVAAAGAAGELAWPMPIPDDLRASLDSPVADLANIGERNGGMMTAAAFLREFVPAGVRWAHIDIAGPGFVTGTPWGHNAKGATGYGVRTLLEVAERMAIEGDREA